MYCLDKFPDRKVGEFFCSLFGFNPPWSPFDPLREASKGDIAFVRYLSVESVPRGGVRMRDTCHGDTCHAESDVDCVSLISYKYIKMLIQ